MILSTEFKQRCHDLVERLAKKLVARATTELLGYFEDELTRRSTNTRPLDLSVTSDSEADRPTPDGLSVSCNHHQNVSNNVSQSNEPTVPNQSTANQINNNVEQKTSEQVAEKVSNLPEDVNLKKPSSVQTSNAVVARKTTETIDSNISSTDSISFMLPSTIAIKSEVFDDTVLVEALTEPSFTVNTPALPANAEKEVTGNLALTEQNISTKRTVEEIGSENENSADQIEVPQVKKLKVTIASESTFSVNQSTASCTAVDSVIVKTPVAQIAIANTSETSPLIRSFSSSEFEGIRTSTDDNDSNNNDNDDDDNYDYDRWSTDNFPDMEVIEIMCYKNQCYEKFKSKTEHEKHLLTEHNLLPFNCLVNNCGLSFANK